jgi:PAS domain S-box-containing protein
MVEAWLSARIVHQSSQRSALLQAILEASPLGLGLTRLRDGMIVDVSAALATILGAPRGALVGKPATALAIHENSPTDSNISAGLAGERPILELPCFLRRADGTRRELRFSTVFMQNHGDAQVLWSLRDVTDELAAQEALKLSEKRLQLALAFMSSTVFHMDCDLRYTYVANPQVHPSVKDVVGHCDAELFTPSQAAQLTAIKQRILASGRGERHELQLGVGGRRYWFDLLLEPEFDRAGAVCGIIGASANITERKLREELYRGVVEDQTELIGRFLADGTMIFVNEVYCRFFGKSPAELVGHNWRPAAHPDDVAMVEALLATIAPRNPVVTIENRVYAADGSVRWMQFVNRGFFEADGKLRELQSVGRDITARKRDEEQLAGYRQQLRELLGANDHLLEEQRVAIAREIHDQLGATLTAALFRIDALKRKVGRDSAPGADLDRVRALLTEANATARDICTRLRPPVLDGLGLAEACRWYLRDWSASSGIRARGRFAQLTQEPADGLRTDIFRILQELLTNVARHSGAARVQVSLLVSSRYLTLTVHDDGRGPGGENAGGLGLLGIRERVRRQGGAVEIDPGARGMLVRVRFPWPPADAGAAGMGGH